MFIESNEWQAEVENFKSSIEIIKLIGIDVTPSLQALLLEHY